MNRSLSSQTCRIPLQTQNKERFQKPIEIENQSGLGHLCHSQG